MRDLHAEVAGRGIVVTACLVRVETEHGERHERAWRHAQGLTAAAVAFLGLALTFAPPLYGYYESLPTRLWGISAAKDQNLGGILMSTEQALVFGAAIVWLLLR